MMKFRALRADEVDVRVAQVREWGVVLLLYKDARCDMNILDETVGPMNWQRMHGRDNANCIVSIWDEEKGQWIGKEDTGTESNTEAAKGLASDSFKRACFNWGIGRELYTAPDIKIRAGKGCTVEKKNGRDVCKDAFSVAEMTVENGRIVWLTIRNDKTGSVVYTWPAQPKPEPQPEPPKPAVICEMCGKPVRPMRKRDGSIWAPADIAAWTQRLHGKAVCWDCHKELNAQADAQMAQDAAAQLAAHEDGGDRA